MSADVVWWTRNGGVLHRDPQCPPFLRSVASEVNAITSAKVTGITAGVGNIQCYDFAVDVMSEGGGEYPPDDWPLCQLCGSRRP